tara:strand:+ start:1123 stop:1278 length:156 start_codon:yes stop_codon:yes gene_type:complete
MVLKPLSMKIFFLPFYVDGKRITIIMKNFAMFETQININKAALIKPNFIDY